MNHSEILQKEIENLRGRLSLLSQVSRLVAGDLDLDTVLQETVDGSRYGVLALLEDAGQVEALLASGLTADEFR